MDELGGVPRPETRETTTARPAFQQRPTTPRTALPEAITKRPDIAEFLGAFAVGAILGASAALLLRPEPLRGTARIRRDLAPYRKRVRQNALLARRNFAASTDAAAAAAEALGHAARTLGRDLRTEVAEIVGNARLDLSDAVNEQVGQALKTLRRGSRFKGRH
jgi:gas vesicle protein